ncbi:MAG TPA: radical SAM protein [Candidatus Acidoferrum sp.]|nr:radical SAM protein [Candidatus Acidoferrum sp.]
MTCTLCPRMCGADRALSPGRCGVTSTLRVARAAPHMWEEPCISGEKGSGAVFFSGCSLGCAYCQNRKISRGQAGRAMTVEALAGAFRQLEAEGVHNLNLVTPTHYQPQIIEALRMTRPKIPVVWNTGGYELARRVAELEGLVQVWLPDFKYMDAGLAGRYSAAPDYPDFAKSAIAEMVRQRPQVVFDGDGMMTGGVMVRHLVLPGHTEDSKRIVRYLFETYGDKIYLSVMNQFTPNVGCPELSRPVTEKEYDEVVGYALTLGVTKAFIQEGDTVGESFIPEFED